MAKEDETFYAWRAEFAKGSLADTAKLKKLDEEHKAAVADAKQYVVTNELGQAIEQAGGTGMNAGTGYDQTVYFLQPAVQQGGAVDCRWNRIVSSTPFCASSTPKSRW
jgi:hypothetical protein